MQVFPFLAVDVRRCERARVRMCTCDLYVCTQVKLKNISSFIIAIIAFINLLTLCVEEESPSEMPALCSPLLLRHTLYRLVNWREE